MLIILRIMKSNNDKRFYSIARKLIIVVILRFSYRMKRTNLKIKHLLTFLIRNRSCSRTFIYFHCKTKVYYIVDVKIGNGKSVSRRMNKEDQKKECRQNVEFSEKRRSYADVSTHISRALVCATVFIYEIMYLGI